MALTGLGGLGIVVLIPVTTWQIELLPEPVPPPLALALLAAIQPFVLLVAAAFIGAVAAPRLGLRSLVAERANGLPFNRGDLHRVGRLVLVSAGLGLAINLADELARPFWLPQGATFPRYAEVWSPVTLLFGMVYGGITEEVMFRWGAMAAAAWLLWRAAGRPAILPDWVPGAAIATAALLFAAGHLPAVAAIVPLSAGPVLRTLVLNGVAGLWFGWIFWRRHLEAAMLSHGAIHIGFAIYAMAGLALA